MIAIIPVSAWLYSYGLVLSKTVKYNYPVYLLVVVVYLFVALVLYADRGPFLYDHEELSVYFIPTFLRIPNNIAKSLTLPGYFHGPLIKLYQAFRYAVDPEFLKVTDFVFRPMPLSIILLLLNFFPVYQQLFVRLQLFLGRVRLQRDGNEPTFRIALYKSYIDPLWHLIPGQHNVFVRLWQSSFDISVFRLSDLFDLALAITFLRYPLYFLSYCLFTLFLHVIVIQSQLQSLSVQDFEASVATKLASLRGLFPKNLTVHKYLDKAPDSVIHSLYAVHVTGTSLDPPIAVRAQYEFLNQLIISAVLNPNSVEVPVVKPVPSSIPTSPISQPNSFVRRAIDERYTSLSKKLKEVLLRVECCESTSEVPIEVLSFLKKVTVTLTSGSKTFTGFFVGSNIVATVAHGKDKNEPVQCSSYPVTEEKIYPEDDLMFCRVSNRRDGVFIPADSRQVTPDTPVVLLTFYPEETIIHGTVKYSNSEAVLAKMPTKPGSSGSAVVTHDGKLVSMHQARMRDNAISLPANLIWKRLSHFLGLRAPSPPPAN
jgi:hypothetical protein